MKVRATTNQDSATLRTLLQEVLTAAKSLESTAKQRGKTAADDDASLMVALDVLTTKARHLRSTVGRRWAAASALETAALRKLLEEPRFAGARMEFPDLPGPYCPDAVLTTAQGSTYVEVKAGRGADLLQAARALDAWLGTHAPAATGIVIGVARSTLAPAAASETQVGRVSVRSMSLR